MLARQIRRNPVAAATISAAVLLILLLAAPGQTVTVKYLNDLFIFLDAAYRITLGQVPNQDFHTALGPLNFYLPALGYWISGSLGAAMPLGMAALIVLVTPVMVHVLGSRMRPLIGIPTAIFLLLTIAAPLNTGEIFTDLSFAMFYNRVGWALLGLLLVMHLPALRPHRRQTMLDGGAAAFLVLLMLLTKISYGIVGIAFLCLVLLQPAQRRWAMLALGLVVAGAGIVELAWGGTVAHLSDLALAADVSGPGPFRGYVQLLFDNRGEYVMFGAVVALALWRTRSIIDFLFYGFCAGAGLALISQNFQTSGVLTLHAALAVAAERLVRTGTENPRPRPPVLPAAAPLVVIVIMLPMIAAGSAALGLHAALAASRQGDALGFPNARGLRLAKTWYEWNHEFYSGYIDSLRDGATLLEGMDPPPERVFVMDFVSPFSSLAGLTPPRGDTAWMHDGRSFNRDVHLAPDELLGDTEIIMVPKRPVAGSTTEALEAIYGDYIELHFEEVRDTEMWRIYRRP